MHINAVKALNLSKKEVLRSVVGAILAASLVAAIIYYSVPAVQENRSSLSNALNTLGFVGTVSFQFVGSDVSELIVAASSAGQGTILMNITQAAPFLIYIDDSGALLNQSTPTLPPGISVSLNMYGKRYDVPSIYEVPLNDSTGLPLSTVQLVPTTLGETTVQYTISVTSAVPTGVYNVNIVFRNILNNGTHYGYAAEYVVILHVQ